MKGFFNFFVCWVVLVFGLFVLSLIIWFFGLLLCLGNYELLVLVISCWVLIVLLFLVWIGFCVLCIVQVWCNVVKVMQSFVEVSVLDVVSVVIVEELVIFK